MNMADYVHVKYILNKFKALQKQKGKKFFLE